MSKRVKLFKRMHYMIIDDARHGNLFCAGYRVNYTHFVDTSAYTARYPITHTHIICEYKMKTKFRWNGSSWTSSIYTECIMGVLVEDEAQHYFVRLNLFLLNRPSKLMMMIMSMVWPWCCIRSVCRRRDGIVDVQTWLHIRNII